MNLSSDAFGPNDSIPERFTCDGTNLSPALSWSGAPQHTTSFALIVDDPDAPSGTFTHWVVYNIPSSTQQFAAGVSRTARLADGSAQGKNDFGDVGYGGPCPPPGNPHHYRFTIYALDAPLHPQAQVTRQRVLEAMRGHVLDQAQLIGLYQRKRR